RPEHGYVGAMWRGYYSALYQVNTLISALSDMTDNPRKKQIEGVAHYFRGYIYYNLVVRFGGVPLLKENTLEKYPRSSVSDVWTFIEKDLEIAIAQAPGFSTDLEGDYYFTSREAAKALMARVKLAQGKNEEAADLAEELINSPSFKLD